MTHLPAQKHGTATMHTTHTQTRPPAPRTGRAPTYARSPTRAHCTWTADPAARPEDRQPGEGERLNTDAPHNGARHPPRGRPPATPTARNNSSQERTLWGRCWAPHPDQPRPGDTCHGTLAIRPKGRAAEEGQRLTPQAPHNGGRPPPPGMAPHHPRGTQPPTGHASQVDSAGPPHPHTRAHSTRVADPESPPRGRAAGEGRAPEPRRPSQRRKAPPPGTPYRHPRSAQRRLARAHAVGPVMGRHAHTNRTRDTRVAEPRLPAPKDRRPVEGQRLTPDAPQNGGRPPPLGTAPHHPRGTQPSTGHASQGDSAGSPHPHTRAHST